MIAWVTLGIAIYESIVILIVSYGKFQFKETIVHSFWWALNQSFMQSPPTFFIAGIAYLFSFQLIFFLVLFRVLMMHHAREPAVVTAFWDSKGTKSGRRLIYVWGCWCFWAFRLTDEGRGAAGDKDDCAPRS